MERKKTLQDFEFLIEKKTIDCKEVIKTCLKIGVISFGGPVTNIGLFNKILVKEKKLISEESFIQLFAI